MSARGTDPTPWRRRLFAPWCLLVLFPFVMLVMNLGSVSVMWFGGLVAAVAGVVGAWRAAHADRTG